MEISKSSQAVYGTEKYDYLVSVILKSRGTDGFFHEPRNSSKLCGIIALRREDRGQFITGYRKTLFINERFADMIDQVRQIIDIDEVITP